MVLALVNPIGSDFIKDFPNQNAFNQNLIDAYSGPCLTSHPLQSFSPGLVGSSGNPVLGTGGVNRAFYYQIFDQVYMWGEWRWGSAGTDFGGGIYSLTLPFSVKTLMSISATFDSSPIVGTGTTYDDSANAGRLPITTHLKSATELYFGIRMNSGSSNRELRSAGYVTWANLDGVSWNARVQRLP